MPVTDLSEYRTTKLELEHPSQVLPMIDELYDAVSVDTETSGLHCDDGATVSAVSVAYRLKAEPDVIWHHAFAFDQGRAQDKGFEEVLYADTPGNRKMKMSDSTTRDVVGLPKGDPLGMWDWHTDYNLPGDEWRALMRWLISAGQAVTLSNANIKFDLHHLKHGTRHFEGVELEKYARWDTQLTSAELWPGESTALKNTGIRLWGEEVAAEAAVVKACLIEVKKRYGLTSIHGPRYDLMPAEVALPYASQDTVLALRLRETQIQMLDDGLGSWRHVDQALDLMRVLYRMEARRFGPIDVELALREADRIQKRMDELAPMFPFQPPTPAQATEYFFVDLGLRPWKTELGEQAREVSIVPDKRKGAPAGATRVKIDHYGSLTEKIADRMADADVEHAREYAEFLRLQNANQMFYRNYANLAGPGDRLMTNFKQAFVKSGRMAVERWQAQAIPKKLKLSILGDPVTEPRGLFLVDSGLTRINLDLKQAELRIAAMMSGCQSMLDQLLAGVDFHTNTTKRVFGIDETDPDWSLTRDIGKRLAQTVDTPIPVPGGWKRAGDIQVDDVIYGRRGLTTVTGVHPQGRIPCYRVTMGDKRYLDVSDQHLWYTLHTTVADCTKRDIRKTKVQTTLELAEEVRRAETDRYRYPHGRGSARGYVSIPFTEPVPGVYRDLPADPYLLGLWLGDGSRTKKRPEVAIAFDPQDYDHYVNVFGPPRRIDAGRVLVYNWAGQGIGRPAGAGVTSPMLRDIWLNHMPEYETADTKQRLALLQGLMDSDGSCSHGTKARRGGSFCNTDRAKADLVVKLVQSLGGYCQVNSIQPKGPRGNAQLAWMVQVFTPEGINPFLLPRKADIYKSMARKMLRVVSVERLPEDQEMVCYTVDAPDSLYLAGDYLVTHNTFSSVFLIGPKSFREQLWLKGGVEYSWQQSCDAVYGWRNTYPEFKIAYDYWAGHFEKHGHVILIDGQPSWLGPRDWPHTGWSRVVQSSLALFVRDWLIRIERMTAKYNALTLTVHDSVNLDLPEQVADQVAADIIEMSEELWLQWFGIPGGVERGSFAKG